MEKEKGILLAAAFLFISIFGLSFLDFLIDSQQLALIDEPVLQWMERVRTPELNRLMLLITTAGNWEVLAMGVILGGILLWAAGKKQRLWWMFLSNLSGGSVVELIKLITNRSRPPLDRAVIEVGGFSFPSGHSYFAVIFYGLITYFWVKHFPYRTQKIIMGILGTGLLLLLALSRIYLGVHWTTDVLGGLALSSLWLVLVISILERQQNTEEKRNFSRKEIWFGFSIFTGLWLLGWMVTYWIKYAQTMN